MACISSGLETAPHQFYTIVVLFSRQSQKQKNSFVHLLQETGVCETNSCILIIFPPLLLKHPESASANINQNNIPIRTKMPHVTKSIRRDWPDQKGSIKSRELV